MKDPVVRRFVQAVYASRMATNDMNDLAFFSDLKLFPSTEDVSELISNLPPEDEPLLRKAFIHWKSVQGINGELSSKYLIPLWGWQNAPFASGKKSELRRLTHDFLIQFGNMKQPTYKKLSKLLSDWVTASNLIPDIEKYLTPKRSFDRVSSPLTVKIEEGKIDINKISLGNEFTTRMPLRTISKSGPGGVVQVSMFDITPLEREQKIEALAVTLQEIFTGKKSEVMRIEADNHGHKLGIAFQLKDHLQRVWRVEWDGINRSYNSNQNVIDGSSRGGHIEIVSPKYEPTFFDIQSVFNAMEKESLVPDYKMGGSHLNIDYAIFENNPQAMARFLTIFHQHRGIISFIFQHPNRLRAAEPVDVSEKLDQGLRKFKGSREDLARLLYDERYFNTRKNRKTRYTQMDVSDFMGPVIPPEFIKDDFDVVRARLNKGFGWSQQFRVTEFKKMECRLLDAPNDELEAALQIKLIRAILNLAINGSEPLMLPVQKVDHESYIDNPETAYRDLEIMAKELNLVVEDYRPYLTKRIFLNEAFIRRKNYTSWKRIAEKNYPKTTDWGEPQNSGVKSMGQCGLLFVN